MGAAYYTASENYLKEECYTMIMNSDMHKVYEITESMMGESYFRNNTTKKLRNSVTGKIKEEYSKLNEAAADSTDKYFTDFEIAEHFTGGCSALKQFLKTITDKDHVRDGLPFMMGKLSYCKDSDNRYEAEKVKNEIIGLGWNPEIPLTESNIKLAKSRVNSMLKRQLNSCYFIDCTLEAKTYGYDEHVSIDNSIVPMYVCVTRISQNENYAHHVALSCNLEALLKERQMKYVEHRSKIYQFYTEDTAFMTVSSQFFNSIHEPHMINELGELAGDYNMTMELTAARAILDRIGESWNPGERMIVKLLCDTADTTDDYAHIKIMCEHFDNYCRKIGIGVPFDQDSPYMPSINYISINPMKLIHTEAGYSMTNDYTGRND